MLKKPEAFTQTFFAIMRSRKRLLCRKKTINFQYESNPIEKPRDLLTVLFNFLFFSDGKLLGSRPEN